MTAADRSRPQQNDVVLAAVRMLIASYFLASAGLVKNADGVTFLSYVMSPTSAEALATTIYYATGFALLIGRFMREAALVLALFCFWSSFGAKLESEPSIAVLMSFWQDMVLVGAVLLIGLTRPGGEGSALLTFSARRRPRRIDPSNVVVRRRDRPITATADEAAKRAANQKPQELDDEPEIDNIFVDLHPA